MDLTLRLNVLAVCAAIVFVGAVLLETAQEQFKNVFHDAHLLIYGALIIVVVLFLPEGIVGTIARWWRRKRAS